MPRDTTHPFLVPARQDVHRLPPEPRRLPLTWSLSAVTAVSMGLWWLIYRGVCALL